MGEMQELLAWLHALRDAGYRQGEIEEFTKLLQAKQRGN